MAGKEHQKAWLIITGLTATLCLIAAARMLSLEWYTLSLDTVTIKVTAEKAWPGFVVIVYVQIAAILLALFFRRVLASWLLASSFVVAVTFAIACFTAFRDDLPSTLQTELAKVAGVTSDQMMVEHSELRFWFIAAVVVASLLVLGSFIFRIRLHDKTNRLSRYERTAQIENQGDSIGLWDSQR